jgi:ubiquinone/menaquinone biosynthesis C-methylase UbiE
MTEESVLDEQIAYYRARAAEYDEWHMRRGRYDRGEKHRRQWFSELATVKSALKTAEPFGECLELACGTGLWTPFLASGATTLKAIDVVPETIEINRSKVASPHVEYEVADLFHWFPADAYDFVFFGFWLSHIPVERFNHFWQMVRAALKPGGRAFFVDSLKTQESTARDHATIADTGVVERKLNDGRTFNIVKVFHDPDRLKKELQDLGWDGSIQTTGDFFYYGCVVPK